MNENLKKRSRNLKSRGDKLWNFASELRRHLFIYFGTELLIFKNYFSGNEFSYVLFPSLKDERLKIKVKMFMGK